jgi:hypothetical protein
MESEGGDPLTELERQAGKILPAFVVFVPTTLLFSINRLGLAGKILPALAESATELRIILMQPGHNPDSSSTPQGRSIAGCRRRKMLR